MKKRICMMALALVLLTACGAKTITPKEATDLALEKIHMDVSHEYSEIFEDRITCEYEERDGIGYYKVEVPFECSCCAYYVRTFTVLVQAETGEIERLMMTK